jgi:membrane protein YdbS with pleckstrin-like domain
MYGKESYLIIIVPVLMLIIFHLNGRQIFEYDSDGEALNLKTGILFLF